MNDSELDRYIERVRQIPKLSREDETKLAKKAIKGNKRAADKLVEANLRYAVAIALQYRRYPIPLGDILAEANVGLVTAVRKFDPDRGTRFVTYAGYWIRAYVLELVVRSARVVGGGTGALRSKLFFKLRRERARARSLGLLGEDAIAEVADRIGEPVPRTRRLLEQLSASDVSLDQPTHDDGRTTLVETMEGSMEAPDESVANKRFNEMLQSRVSDALETLDEREQYIVRQRILKVDDAMTLSRLGENLGVSRERARQLEARAKRKLRAQLSDLQPA